MRVRMTIKQNKRKEKKRKPNTILANEMVEANVVYQWD